MEKIVNSKEYDTKTAYLIASYNNGFKDGNINYCSETLYKKEDGEFFLYGKGGSASKYAVRCGVVWKSGEHIFPLTTENARLWLEVHRDTDIYEKEQICLTLPSTTVRILNTFSHAIGLSVSEIVDRQFKINLESAKDHNFGNTNIGHYYNFENTNIGCCNAGNNNTGCYNDGSYNTGSFNKGSMNTGDYNKGESNAGFMNSGNFNSGNYNIGDRNVGEWNRSSFNAGCFNTTEPKARLFNKPSEWTFKDWWGSDAARLLAQMPGRDPQKWWNGLTSEQKNIIKAIPNFDPDVFKECTGIKVK